MHSCPTATWRAHSPGPGRLSSLHAWQAAPTFGRSGVPCSQMLQGWRVTGRAQQAWCWPWSPGGAALTRTHDGLASLYVASAGEREQGEAQQSEGSS